MTTNNNELTFTIISEEEGFNRINGRGYGGSLYSDMMSYCDTKSLNKLKKELGIDSKRKIKYVIVQSYHHKNFVCKQNKKITYKYPVCCLKDWEGVVKDGSDYVTHHPYGHVMIALKNQKKKEEEDETK